MMRVWLILALLFFLTAEVLSQGSLQTVDDLYLSGVRKLSKEDYLGAVIDLRLAYELDSTDTRISRALGFALFNAGNLMGSAQLYERTISLQPDDHVSATQLAIIYLDDQIQDYDKAVQYAELATQLNPSSDLAFYALATAYERSGQYENAERYYRSFMDTFLESEYREKVASALKKLNRDTFILVYKVVLENESTVAANNVRTLIMLARDFSPYQKVVLLSAKPEFTQVMSDPLGNKFVEYRFDKLGPGEKSEITFDYLVEVKPTVYEISGTADVTLTRALAPHLESEHLIECNSSSIINTSDSITAGASDALEKARRVYDYVTAKLNYNVQARSLGAEHALAHPEQADCTEFASLFVALSRASAVPARVIYGFTRESKEKHITTSHAWAEFYLDDFGWVPVDPTYGSRYSEEYFGRIDSNHLALWSQSPLFRGKWSIIVFHSGTDSSVQLSASETADIQGVTEVRPNLELAKLMDFPKVVAELPPLRVTGTNPLVLLFTSLFFFIILIALILSRRFSR